MLAKNINFSISVIVAKTSKLGRRRAGASQFMLNCTCLSISYQFDLFSKAKLAQNRKSRKSLGWSAVPGPQR